MFFIRRFIPEAYICLHQFIFSETNIFEEGPENFGQYAEEKLRVWSGIG